MKKTFAIILAVLALASCKTKELTNKINDLEQKFKFSMEIDCGPYYCGTSEELEYSHKFDIPFKFNGNVEDLSFVTSVTVQGYDIEPKYEIEMTSNNEGVLHVELWPDLMIDGGEADIVYPESEISIMAFNADGMSVCKKVLFLEEDFYFCDDACDLQNTDVINVGKVNIGKEAGTYNVTLSYYVYLPKGCQAPVVDLKNQLHLDCDYSARSNLTLGAFTLDENQPESFEDNGYLVVGRNYTGRVTYKANTSGAERTMEAIIMKNTSPTSSSSWFYIKFVQAK